MRTPHRIDLQLRALLYQKKLLADWIFELDHELLTSKTPSKKLQAKRTLAVEAHRLLTDYIFSYRDNPRPFYMQPKVRRMIAEITRR